MRNVLSLIFWLVLLIFFSSLSDALKSSPAKHHDDIPRSTVVAQAR